MRVKNLSTKGYKQTRANTGLHLESTIQKPPRMPTRDLVVKQEDFWKLLPAVGLTAKVKRWQQMKIGMASACSREPFFSYYYSNMNIF